MTLTYGNWWLTGFYLVLACVFVYGLLRPVKRVEWRSAGAAHAFVIALYAEMYGLPLTMYLVAWLTGRSEFVQDHFHGHAWAYLFGWGDTGAIALDVVGQCLIVAGAVLALVGWRQIHRGKGSLVKQGLYRHIRHPQYTGFFLFLLGSIINWPTLPTLLMMLLLAWTYYRLARREEADAEASFGEHYREYRRRTGMFLPRWGGKSENHPPA
jgi:methanethiol S-methyltransferase